MKILGCASGTSEDVAKNLNVPLAGYQVMMDGRLYEGFNCAKLWSASECGADCAWHVLLMQ